jgi:hypothetical protein
MPGFAHRSSRARSARPAPGTPDPALPPGAPRPAEPLDAPGHDSSALAGPGVGEVPVPAAPRAPGAGVVDLRPVPLRLATHRQDQGRPRGHCCGQPGKAPGQARDGTLRGSRSSSPITSHARTTPVAGSYPRPAARALLTTNGCGHAERAVNLIPLMRWGRAQRLRRGADGPRGPPRRGRPENQPPRRPRRSPRCRRGTARARLAPPATRRPA